MTLLGIGGCSASTDGDSAPPVAKLSEPLLRYDVHHIAANWNDGTLQETIRHKEGFWDPYTPIPTTGLPSNHVYEVEEQSQGETGTRGVHVTTVMNGRLYHALRSPGGQWSAWGDASTQSNAQIALIGVGGLADDGRDLHVCALGADYHFYHTIRFSAQNSWQQLNDATGPAGAPTDIYNLDCAGANGDVYVVLNDTSLRLWWARRSPNGWRRFTPVEMRGFPGDQRVLRHTVAMANGNLQVIAMYQDRAYHAVMTPNETWTAWAPLPTQYMEFVSLANDGIDLHLIGTEFRFNPTTGRVDVAIPKHASRSSETLSWSGFGDIQTQAGLVGSQMVRVSATGMR